MSRPHRAPLGYSLPIAVCSRPHPHLLSLLAFACLLLLHAMLPIHASLRCLSLSLNQYSDRIPLDHFTANRKGAQMLPLAGYTRTRVQIDGMAAKYADALDRANDARAAAADAAGFQVIEPALSSPP